MNKLSEILNDDVKFNNLIMIFLTIFTLIAIVLRSQYEIKINNDNKIVQIMDKVVIECQAKTNKYF